MTCPEEPACATGSPTGPSRYDGGMAFLPGERASTIVPRSVVNSLFRWVLKTKGAFRDFLLSIVAMPKGKYSCSTSTSDGLQFRPLWPMLVPYPEVFTKKVNSGDDWLKSLVCLQVMALSWLHLGRPCGAPAEMRLGAALTPQQWNVALRLRHYSVDGNTPEFVDASSMSRAASKMESMEETIAALHRSLASMHVDGSYFGERLDKQVEFDDSWMRSGSLVGSLKKNEMCSAKPIVASRLEFPKAPSFDPVEFFDAATAHAYLFPLELAVDHHAYKGEVPRVSVHAAPEQKVALFKKLHQCGRLREVPEHLARDPFVSGLFCVNKNATLDRLILDARPPNLLEPARNYWCSSMASATGLCDIFIPPDVDLCSSGLDLKDFFYQFVVSEQRVERNILSGSLSRAEAEEIFGPCDDRPDEVRVALATLAMGDLLACEFSQEAHLSLCLRYHVFNPGELLTLRTPLPRSKVIAGVIIDDLVVMELLCRQEQLARPHGPDGYNDRIKNALAAYEENDLEANIKKSFFNETCARFWGCEIDGRKGLVRSSTLRAWPLVVITMRVAMLGYSSVKLLETMAGSWINILTMRRRMFCLLDLIFEAMSVGDASSIVALSPALQDELCVISCTFLLACGDLRAGFLPFISATDASCDGMGGVRADLAEEAVMEVARYSLKKSTWTRLLPRKRLL